MIILFHLESLFDKSKDFKPYSIPIENVAL